jgi:hypothetical protein
MSRGKESTDVDKVKLAWIDGPLSVFPLSHETEVKIT